MHTTDVGKRGGNCVCLWRLSEAFFLLLLPAGLPPSFLLHCCFSILSFFSAEFFFPPPLSV